MTRRENEAVAVQPPGVSRVADEAFAKEHGPHVSGPEWQAQMAGIAFMDGVHGETTGLIGSGLEECGIHVQWKGEKGAGFSTARAARRAH